MVGIDEGAVETLGELFHTVYDFGDCTGIILVGTGGELVERVHNYEIGLVVVNILDVVDEFLEGTGLAS